MRYLTFPFPFPFLLLLLFYPDMFDPFTDKSSYTAIRKHSAQHDLYNRLHSIARDTEFVDRVRGWYEGMVVVRECIAEGGVMWLMIGTANQRCGVWYCNPEVSFLLTVRTLLIREDLIRRVCVLQVNRRTHGRESSLLPQSRKPPDTSSDA